MTKTIRGKYPDQYLMLLQPAPASRIVTLGVRAGDKQVAMTLTPKGARDARKAFQAFEEAFVAAGCLEEEKKS